jgi:hypothetical protein
MSSGNAALRLFHGISGWLLAHECQWFTEHNCRGVLDLLESIDADVFHHGLSNLDRGYLRAMLVAEVVTGCDTATHQAGIGDNDKCQFSQKELEAVLLDCSRACHSSRAHIEEIQFQLYDSAWVHF